MIMDIATWVVDKDLGVERGLISVDSAVDCLNQLYYDKNTYDEVAAACFAVTQRPEYRWESVSAGFAAAIQDLLNDK